MQIFNGCIQRCNVYIQLERKEIWWGITTAGKDNKRIPFGSKVGRFLQEDAREGKKGVKDIKRNKMCSQRIV